MNEPIFHPSAQFVILAQEVMQTLPPNLLGMQLMPDEAKDAYRFLLMQPKPVIGRVQWRGFNNDARPTRSPFAYEHDVCVITPGSWAESFSIDEHFIRTYAQPGTWADPINLRDYERNIVARAATRIFQTKENLIWQALVNGYVEERNDTGITVWSQRYRIIRARFSVSACDRQNSTPIADLACIFNSVIGVSGAAFDNNAVMYANRRTWECILRNTNPNDLGGEKSYYLPEYAFTGIARLSAALQARGLPKAYAYDGFWFDEARRVNYYIPTGKIVAIGVRPDGERLGAFYNTPLLHLPNAPTLATDAQKGTFIVRLDTADPATGKPWSARREITWVYGFEGIPVIEHPTSVVVIDTGCGDCECEPVAEACPPQSYYPN